MAENGTMTENPPTSSPEPIQSRFKDYTRWPEATRAKLRKDYVSGLGSLVALAKEMGIPEDTAQQWSKAQRWPELKRKWAAAELARLEQATEQPQRMVRVDDGTNTDLPRVGLGSRVREVETMIDAATKAYLEACQPQSNPISQANQAKNIQSLAMTLDRMYMIWSLLTGHEKPGTRQPMKPKSMRRGYLVPVPDQPPTITVEDIPVPDPATDQGQS